jgi:membrane protease YdiL (CAAX protease family)
MTTLASAPAASTTSLRARRGLALYLAVLLPPTVLIEGYLFLHPEYDGLTALLAVLPAVASITARLVLREGFGDVSFRLRGPRVVAGCGQALAVATLVALPTFAAGWLTGLAPIDIHASRRLTLDTAVLALVTFVLVLGEELGWRGYMLTRLIDAGVRHPILVSGLVWYLWHVPLVFAGAYLPSRTPIVTAALLLATMLPFAVVSARLRLATGSIWPPVVLHAGWNVLMYELLGPFTTGPDEALWVGEAGVLTAGAMLVAAVLTRPPSSHGHLRGSTG